MQRWQLWRWKWVQFRLRAFLLLCTKRSSLPEREALFTKPLFSNIHMISPSPSLLFTHMYTSQLRIHLYQKSRRFFHNPLVCTNHDHFLSLQPLTARLANKILNLDYNVITTGTKCYFRHQKKREK